ncbi:hypothetical protein AMECASPLE_029434 [Ameca splendens]|uniref:Uncharacterized protein n=1 Tax=Ameca splendens TaxID=208324 RepID=A0ABV1A3E3_9TELE
MWGTNGAGLRTTLENWDTLRTRTHQRERAIQGHKGGSAGIGTGRQKKSDPIRNSGINSTEENGPPQRHRLASLLMMVISSRVAVFGWSVTPQSITPPAYMTIV